MNSQKCVWSLLVGGGAIGLPLAVGMLQTPDAPPDARDILAALIAAGVGSLVAGLWALRAGPMDEGRASTLGCLSWMTVSLLAAISLNPSHAFTWPMIVLCLVIAVPAAVLGLGMGVLVHWAVRPCLRHL
jgi:hypothetical protein